MRNNDVPEVHDNISKKYSWLVFCADWSLWTLPMFWQSGSEHCHHPQSSSCPQSKSAQCPWCCFVSTLSQFSWSTQSLSIWTYPPYKFACMKSSILETSRLHIKMKPDELVLVLHHLSPDMFRPASLCVVHAGHLDCLGLSVHVWVCHGGVTS